MAMPSLFGSLPLGFVAAMDTLDALPAEHAATLARNALEVVARAAPRAAPASVFQALLNADAAAGTSAAALESASFALEHVYRAATAAQATGAALGEALTPFLAPGNAAHAAIRDAWEARAESLGLTSGAAPAAALPTYAGMSWSLGVTVASWEAPRDGDASGGGDDAAATAAPAGAVDETLVPFVGLALRTLTPGGEEATTNLRLSLPEFRDFTKAVKGMQQRLETMQ